MQIIIKDHLTVKIHPTFFLESVVVGTRLPVLYTFFNYVFGNCCVDVCREAFVAGTFGSFTIGLVTRILFVRFNVFVDTGLFGLLFPAKNGF